MTNFYQFSQNNSGGSFHVTDTLCHRLFIEATSKESAILTAEGLGCYWNGVSDGIDCKCCGDRWSDWADVIDLDAINKVGRQGLISCDGGQDEIVLWNQKYGKYPVHTSPKYTSRSWGQVYEGTIQFDSIEQYAEFLSEEYNATTPDVRIFYLDGTVREF